MRTLKNCKNKEVRWKKRGGTTENIKNKRQKNIYKNHKKWHKITRM